jgi:hypothetical protein
MNKFSWPAPSNRTGLQCLSPALWLFVILLGGPAVAQDTGGGVGGTGMRQESDLIKPAAGSDPSRGCTKENSVGVFELKNKANEQIIRKDYVCRGQLYEVKSSEVFELYLRTGEKITILENSAFVIE